MLNWPIKIWSRGYTFNLPYYHHQIGSIKPSHCCQIYIAVWPRWLYHHMLYVSYISQEIQILFPLLLCSLMMCANIRVPHGPMVIFVLCKRMWSYCISKVPVRYTLSNVCVCKIKSIPSFIFRAIYGVVCIQPIHFSCNDCENKFTCSYYCQQNERTNHLPLCRAKLQNSGMRCMTFYVLYYKPRVVCNYNWYLLSYLNWCQMTTTYSHIRFPYI